MQNANNALSIQYLYRNKWNNVNPITFGASSAYNAIAIDAKGVPYVAFSCDADAGQACVRRWVKPKWNVVGTQVSWRRLAGGRAGGRARLC